MIQFIIKRMSYGLFVVLGVTMVIFVLFSLIPVNSARLTMGQRADAASVEMVEKQFHLNEPTWKRFLLYLNDISPLSFHNTEDTESIIFLDEKDYEAVRLIPMGQVAMCAKIPYLGRSFQNGKRVNEILSEKLPSTAILAVLSILLASLIGIPLGVLAAIKRNTLWDNAAVTVSTLGISLPSYVAAMIIAFVFGYYLSDWTGLNARGPLKDYTDLGDPIYVWKNLLLPVIALGMRPVAIITLLTRSSMLDVLNQDYIRTAKAKGLSRMIVIFKHALRNALNPVITSISGWFAALLAGAFFIEIVFDFKGLGHKTVTALLSFDFPVVMGAVLFIAVAFVIINIFVDVVYSFLDPRVSVKSA